MYTLGIFLLCLINLVYSSTLPELIKQIKPSIVGIGTYQATRRPPSRLYGTGFIVADGSYVITNFHVLPKDLGREKREYLVVFYQQSQQLKSYPVMLLDSDREHDLALLKLTGPKFPALDLAEDDFIDEGESIFFTGFPIGAVLGLHPVTHQGIISAITPMGTPMPSAGQLSSSLIKRLSRPYQIYQLDATAYPGNSGSPLFLQTAFSQDKFLQENGKVIGVINKVFIKESKESVLEKPSGITYAIPVKYVRQLLKKNKLPF